MCRGVPVSLPTRLTRVLKDYRNSLMGGIPGALWDPDQGIVMLPWPELTSTWIYDSQGYCDGTVIWNDLICDIRRGHLSDEGGSRHTARSRIFRLSEVPPSRRRLLVRRPPHALGLGPNSTYLNSMRNAGLVASRSWSMYWGREYADDDIDGSIVVGGCDSERMIGDRYTMPLDYDDYENRSGCWTGTKVNISEIILNSHDGSDDTIYSTAEPLSVCIVPQRQLLPEAPGDVFSSSEETTDARPSNISYDLGWDGHVYLEDDLVPNSQYMVPGVEITREGDRAVDDSKRVLLINDMGGSDGPFTLGRSFSTAAYLDVDHENGSFSLWKANPTSSSKLVSIVSEDAAEECSGKILNSGNGTSDDGPDAHKKTSSAMLGGAIGGTLGGVAIASAAAFFLWCRRRQMESWEIDPSIPMMLGDTFKSPIVIPQTYQELPVASQHIPREMEGDVPSYHELDGRSELGRKGIGNGPSAVSAERALTP
ncbi:hypothetical protein GMORB2_1842 [Geosmithia morbida]|uniref:Uncharacterized protein n=1 Tax=Geosmithia morbida TaxID=1094350 RepID=A0A9P4YSV2_9HYPO|nr:uncharacterized protein GMORB2_1842 [Geosmithia morbida]KAF4121435.1 hypothetical protein GMORB2_1842 [Geosmithia morbida]